jgi:hypothetical protein
MKAGHELSRPFTNNLSDVMLKHGETSINQHVSHHCQKQGKMAPGVAKIAMTRGKEFKRCVVNVAPDPQTMGNELRTVFTKMQDEDK